MNDIIRAFTSEDDARRHATKVARYNGECALLVQTDEGDWLVLPPESWKPVGCELGELIPPHMGSRWEL